MPISTTSRCNIQLRVSEACGLRLGQVDIESRVLHVARLKVGLSTTHPLRGNELRVIKTWLVERAKMKPETDAFFRFCQLVEADIVIRQTGMLPRSSLPLRPPALYPGCE